MDGPTSNFDEHGRMPNVVRPMAYLDVQVLAAEALAPGGRPAGRPPAASACAPSRAPSATPPSPTSGCPSGATSAHAIDRDSDGRPRLLRAVQSNAGWMLATSFFDELPETQRAALVGGIVRMLFSAELLTPAGIRGRASDRPQPALSQLPRERLAVRHRDHRPGAAPPGPGRARRAARSAPAERRQHARRRL